jgi:hypothetical protein
MPKQDAPPRQTGEATAVRNTKAVTPHFLPWLRTGLASHITDLARNGVAPGDSATVSVRVQLRASGTQDDVNETVPSPDIRLRGPGEVVGIDPTLIVRHDPEPGTNDAESTYLVLIEFSAADLPWRYTPAAASGNRLQPWIALVVLEERDGVRLETGRTSRVPVLHVDDVGHELPDLNQSWAWAHVHANHDLSNGIAAALAAAPEAFRARLLCPRRLLPNRSWLACVVPTFEAGRRAGLGEPVTANMGLAWTTAKTGELRLPVYHSWRFQTGPAGDFESLVRRLKARELPPSVGRRDLDISDPGGGLPGIKHAAISYQGALVSPSGKPRPWPAQQRRRLKAALRDLLNAALVRTPPPASYDALRDDPVVGPPAYAALQAQRRTVPAEGEPPKWFGELNTEPQHRAVAGLGTEVIRHDQEALMAKAWEYAASAVEASRILTRARTAWEVARRAQRRFDALPDERFVQLAGPAMARLRPSARRTIKGAVTGSALPEGLLSGAFRRLSHTVPGFVTTTANDRTPSTATITRAVLADAVRFVGQWASVKSPANADVENVSQPARTSRTRRGRQATPQVTPRIATVVTPYTGNNEPARSLATRTRAALDPLGTIASMVHTRISGLPAGKQDVPERVFVRPVFTTPMYRRLVALSVEYLLPGVGDIPSDTLGLLTTNPPFIEAFMAGLNYEMGREFLWREYPVQLDGTWLQYFWEGGPRAHADIVPIRHWQDAAGLGVNAPNNAPQASLVLLIRSALLRRYPDLRVYAVEAAWEQQQGKNVRREAIGGTVKTPLFVARLTADMTVFGFDLSVEDARGSTNPASHPGYFFVLEQQPGAPRFGLDARRSRQAGKAPASWTSVSWSHLVEKDAPLPAFIDVNGPSWLQAGGALPSNSDAPGAAGQDTWGEDAAAMARITFQRPVRLLVHADAMLPEARATTKDRP